MKKRAYRILFVEDDDSTRTIIGRAIGQAGYTVMLAPDGTDAVTLLQQAIQEEQPYDVVITDIRMDGLDGIGVLHEVQDLEPQPSVILLTGYPSVESAIEALRLRAFDYLRKPCNIPQLLARIAHALEERERQQQLSTEKAAYTRILDVVKDFTQPQQPGPDTGASQETEAGRFLQVGTLCMDCYRKTVSVADRSVKLTPTEYRLLYVLLAHQGNVLRFRDIVQHSHGHVLATNDDSEDSEGNKKKDGSDRQAHALLRWHVRNINNKLGRNYIQKVKHIGYYIKSEPSGGGEGER